MLALHNEVTKAGSALPEIFAGHAAAAKGDLTSIREAFMAQLAEFK